MVKVTEELISPQLLLDSLKTDSSGSIVMHLGIVRPQSEGRRVISIKYEADINAAESELLHIAKEIGAKWRIQDIALCRRTGRLDLGAIILMVAIASPHRKEAFEACEYAVERMRSMQSIRKEETLQ